MEDLFTQFRKRGYMTNDNCSDACDTIKDALIEVEKEWEKDRDKPEYANVTVFQYIINKLGI